MSAGSSIGVGVIGLGAWGENHIRALQSLPLVRVVAIASSDPTRAREIGVRYGIARYYGSAEDLAADPDVDAITIASDERNHRAAALAAIDARKPLLVEKPIALTLEDANAMVDAAATAGVFFMPGHLLRFDTSIATARDRIAAGDLGTTVSVRAQRLVPADRYMKYSRTHPALSVAIHDIDLVLWLVDSPVVAVHAWERNVQGGANPDVLWALLEFESGAIGVVTTLWLVPERTGVFLDSTLEFTGSRGMARVQNPGGGLGLWLDSGPFLPDTTLAPTVGGAVVGALRDELAHFLLCVIEGRSSDRITAREAVKSLEVALLIQERARQVAI